MSYKLVIKDAFWQISGRIFSAIWWFIVIKLISPYLGPLRFWDYSTILKYFAIWSALADFWLYVVALKEIWKLKNWKWKIEEWKVVDIEKSNTNIENNNNSQNHEYSTDEISTYYSKFVTSRLVNVVIVYWLALLVAYFIPSYTSNPYIAWWLPLWMLFSASFMMAWIIQIPLQLYWKMEQLSIALIIARVVQIAILFWLVVFYPHFVSDWSSLSIILFQIIFVSVVASWVVQWIYVYFVGKKYLPFKYVFDPKFTINHIKNNFKYGLAYYLSSFHTLVVLILLSIFFPTKDQFTYVWIWSVALALIEILLIVPSSLWNSIIHKISWYNLEDKLKSFWNLMIFIIWIGLVFLVNFWVFDNNIILFVSWEKYLTTSTQIWADFILPFLGIVLALSFIKQIFNYIFVATDMQNKLFEINLFWVVLGVGIWLPFIMKYNLLWWVFTQVLLELLFVAWAIFVAKRNKVFPIIDYKKLFLVCMIVVLTAIWFKFIPETRNIWLFFIYWAIFNTILLAASYKPIKAIVKQL